MKTTLDQARRAVLNAAHAFSRRTDEYAELRCTQYDLDEAADRLLGAAVEFARLRRLPLVRAEKP